MEPNDRVLIMGISVRVAGDWFEIRKKTPSCHKLKMILPQQKVIVVKSLKLIYF